MASLDCGILAHGFTRVRCDTGAALLATPIADGIGARRSSRAALLTGLAAAAVAVAHADPLHHLLETLLGAI